MLGGILFGMGAYAVHQWRASRAPAWKPVASLCAGLVVLLSELAKGPDRWGVALAWMLFAAPAAVGMRSASSAAGPLGCGFLRERSLRRRSFSMLPGQEGRDRGGRPRRQNFGAGTEWTVCWSEPQN